MIYYYKMVCVQHGFVYMCGTQFFPMCKQPGTSTQENVAVEEFFLPYSCYNATEIHFNDHHLCKARIATSTFYGAVLY